MLTHHGIKLVGPLCLRTSQTLGNDDLTPTVQGSGVVKCATGHTAAKSLTNFDNGYDGQIIIIKGANPTYKTTLADGTYLKLNGNWVEADNNMITLINIAGVWYELSRSANS